VLLQHKPTKVLVTGVSGSGKSTYFIQYVQNARSLFRTIFVFDHEGEFAYRLNAQSAFTPDQMIRQFDTGLVIYDPSEMFEGDIPAAFAFFAEWSFAVTKASVLATGEYAKRLFACDELQTMVGTDSIPREFALVLETGRRWGLDAIVIAQQLNLCHNRIRNQITEMVAFQTTEPLVLGALQERGFNPEAVASLQPFEFILRNRAGFEQTGKITL
jgi:hypothetical protein